MNQKNCFLHYHPCVNALYFFLVIGFTLFCLNVITICISLTVGLLFVFEISVKKPKIGYVIALFGMTALINPMFNHQGVTILFYLPSGNPFTLESVQYGLVSGGMLASVVVWFKAVTVVLTPDKIMYLLGRILPTLGLVFSMILGFVPKLKHQFKQVVDGQKALGKWQEKGHMLTQIKQGATVVSVLIGWSLEQGVITADSMKARGYGLPKPTHFSLFRFRKQDGYIMAWLFALGGIWVVTWKQGYLAQSFFPVFQIAPWNVGSAVAHGAFLLLAVTPIILQEREDRKWNYTK